MPPGDSGAFVPGIRHFTRRRCPLGVLDIVDTQPLIWRGWAQDSVEGVLDNQDRMAKNIDEAVRRMLRRFPWSSSNGDGSDPPARLVR